MKLNLVQKIYNNRTIKDKNGVERKQKMFFLKSEGGKSIAIKPVFNEGYTLLDAYADIEFDDSEKPVKENDSK